MLLHLLRTPNHTPTTSPPPPSTPIRSEKWGVMLTMLRERGYSVEEDWVSFLCNRGGRCEEPPPPPTPPKLAPPGRSPDVKLRPPPSLSLHGNQQSFQETKRETESSTMPQNVTMTESRLTEISETEREREREREREFDLLQPWEVTKILRNLMILVHITMNASGSFIITLMVCLGLE